MARLIYVTNMSLDGYIEDKRGSFDKFTPDDVFRSTTDLLRSVVFLYGRRLWNEVGHLPIRLIQVSARRVP